MALEEKYNYLENTSVENVVDDSMYLTKKKSSKLLDFFNFIKSLFVHSDFENSVDIVKKWSFSRLMYQNFYNLHMFK